MHVRGASSISVVEGRRSVIRRDEAVWQKLPFNAAGLAYFVRRSRDGCSVIKLYRDDREEIVASGLDLMDAEKSAPIY